MGDEKPVSISKRKLTSISSTGELTCIVHYPQSRDTEITDLSVNQFATIQNALCVRQLQSTDCNRLDDICASIPETFDASLHGSHRWCYKNFTNISRLMTRADLSDVSAPVMSESSGARKSGRCSISTSQVLFPQTKCLFL